MPRFVQAARRCQAYWPPCSASGSGRCSRALAFCVAVSTPRKPAADGPHHRSRALLNIWFGYGLLGVAASACIVAIFPVIANTVDGLRPLTRASWSCSTFTELPRMTMASSWAPGRIAPDLHGLRVAAGLSVIGAVVGELSAASSTIPPSEP